MPKVDKNILILVSGIMWSGVGVLLTKISSKWFHLYSTNYLIIMILGGVLLGSAISYFGFSNLAQKNIDRINLYKGKVCVWAFQKWQSYILIIFMISLGIFMRTSPIMPKFILIPMYIAIGFALFSASFKYYIFLYRRKKA